MTAIPSAIVTSLVQGFRATSVLSPPVDMQDLALVALTFVFFAVSWLYVKGLERL